MEMEVSKRWSLYQTELSNKLFRLEVHLWDLVILTDNNKLAKASAGRKESIGIKKIGDRKMGRGESNGMWSSRATKRCLGCLAAGAKQSQQALNLAKGI